MKKALIVCLMILCIVGVSQILNAATPKYCKVKAYCYISGMLNEIISCDSETGDCSATTTQVICDGEIFNCPSI